MKPGFVYTSPHAVHRAWAESINSVFIEDRLTGHAIPALSRLIKSISTARKIPEGVNLLLCESSSNLFTGAIWKSGNPECKLVLIASDPKWSSLSMMPWAKKKAYAWALSKLDLILATSPMMMEKFPETLKAKVRVVFPFADIKRFSKQKASLNSKNLIYTGRLSRDKGADLVLESFKLIKQEFRESKLYFVGKSTTLPREGNLRAQLEAQNLQDVVYTGEVKNPEEYMKNCSILMSLARTDAANISIVEAMCMGLIPIVSEGVGNKYIVSKLSPELIVHDETEAAERVITLWRAPKKVKAYSVKARRISQYYNKENSLKLFKEAVSSLKLNPS